MASLTLNVNHRLSQDEALDRIKNLLGKTKQEHSDEISDLKENWKGNVGEFSFKAKGFAISGTLTVNQSNVSLDGTIPFALSVFKGKIKSFITEEAEKLLR